MARLIDADKRIAEIKNQYCTGCDNYGGVRCRACWVDDAMCLIDDAPTVDAVEVVRCRDCNHWKPSGRKAGNSFSDMEYIGGCEFTNYCRRESDFCSYGERKDDDRWISKSKIILTNKKSKKSVKMRYIRKSEKICAD